MKTMTFLEALDDPRLLKPWTRKLDLSAWRIFHAAVDGERIDPANLGLFIRCTGRLEFPTVRAAEIYGGVGRRGLKTVNASLRVVYETAIRTEWQNHLAPGQQAIYAIISVDRQAAREAFNYISGILHSTPLLKSMIGSVAKEEIILKNGAIIQIRVASYRSVRGPAYIGAVLDELAFFRDADTAANPTAEIISAISPAILPGGQIIGISSVFNRQGYLWEMYQKYFGKDGDVLFWHAPTLLMNPTFSTKKIERERTKDAASAAAEFDSIWRDDISTLYSAEAIDAACIPGRGDLPYCAYKTRYFAFCDPSGGRRDSAALAIAHRDTSGKVIVDMMTERKSPHDPGEVVKEFSALLQAYHLAKVSGDRYGGEWPVAAYRKQGITYELSDMTASELYLAALPLFSGGMIELPGSDRLRGQLCSLMRRTSTGGKDSVIAGQSDSSHSDLANAAIGAVILASQEKHGGAGICFSDTYIYGPNAGEKDSESLENRTRQCKSSWDVIPAGPPKQVIIMGNLPKK
ncbi:MAG: hypothetical protein MUP71_11635 [Candidatus Aminicenantes bacterium]|nr:hypothetical protein [Candidatus Aminicenantes bacterium]